MVEDIAMEDLPKKLIFDQGQPSVEDPCEMTIRGHTSGVRCCQYSPDGTMIISTAEDASLRIWDASRYFLSSSSATKMTAVHIRPYSELLLVQFH